MPRNAGTGDIPFMVEAAKNVAGARNICSPCKRRWMAPRGSRYTRTFRADAAAVGMKTRITAKRKTT